MALSQEDINKLILLTNSDDEFNSKSLPEFMRKSYTQIPGVEGYVAKSGLSPFDPFEGDVQSLFLSSYNKQMPELERQFQQQSAIRPDMYKKRYTPGAFVPSDRASSEWMPKKDSFNPALLLPFLDLNLPDLDVDLPDLDVDLGGVEDTLKDIGGEIGDIVDTGVDVVEGAVEGAGDVVEKVGGQIGDVVDVGVDIVEGAAESAGDVIEDVGGQVGDVVDVGVDVVEEVAEQFGEDVLKPVGGELGDATDVVVDAVEGAAETAGDAIEEIIGIIPSISFAGMFDAFGNPFEGIGDAFDEFGNPIRDIENFVNTAQDLIDATENPHASTTLDAIENMNDTYGTEVLDPDLAGTLTDISAVIGIANALDDPTLSNLAGAYGDAAYLADNLTDIYLPGGETAGTVGSLISGIEALEDGIETPEEALSLANAANLATGTLKNLQDGKTLTASLTGAEKSGFASGETLGNAASIISGLTALEGGIDSPQEAIAFANALSVAASYTAGAATAGSAMATLAGASAFLGPLAIGMFVMDALGIDPIIDVLGIGDDGSIYGNAVLDRDEYGNYNIESESSKNKAFKNIMPEAHVAGVVFNELENKYGFDFNQEAWNNLNKRVDFDEGKMPRGAIDLVIDAIDSGALIATENTPDNLAWQDIFGSARDRISKAGDRAWKSKSTSDFYITRRDYAGEADELLKEAGISDSDLAMAVGPIDLGFNI